MKKKLTSKTILFCLVLLAATCLALIEPETDAEIIAGDYVWITRAADDPAQDACAEHVGSECVELCQQLGTVILPMSMTCCLESSKVGGWDHPDECVHWIH